MEHQIRNSFEASDALSVQATQHVAVEGVFDGLTEADIVDILGHLPAQDCPNHACRTARSHLSACECRECDGGLGHGWAHIEHLATVRATSARRRNTAGGDLAWLAARGAFAEPDEEW